MGLNSFYNINYIMRIFIKDYNKKKLSDFMVLLNKYYMNSEQYIEIYSKEGMYKINDKECLKIISFDKEPKIFNNFYNNNSIFVDYSKLTSEKTNQIP